MSDLILQEHQDNKKFARKFFKGLYKINESLNKKDVNYTVNLLDDVFLNKNLFKNWINKFSYNKLEIYNENNPDLFKKQLTLIVKFLMIFKKLELITDNNLDFIKTVLDNIELFNIILFSNHNEFTHIIKNCSNYIKNKPVENNKTDDVFSQNNDFEKNKNTLELNDTTKNCGDNLNSKICNEKDDDDEICSKCNSLLRKCKCEELSNTVNNNTTDFNKNQIPKKEKNDLNQNKKSKIDVTQENNNFNKIEVDDFQNVHQCENFDSSHLEDLKSENTSENVNETVDKKRKKYSKKNKDEILKNTVNNIINNRIKNEELYKNLYKFNRDNIKLFSNIYDKYKISKQIDDTEFDEIWINFDKNKSRFLKICKVYYEIFNTPSLFNSKLLFLPYCFNEMAANEDTLFLFKIKIDEHLKLNN
jgi:hypothetical protein